MYNRRVENTWYLISSPAELTISLDITFYITQIVLKTFLVVTIEIDNNAGARTPHVCNVTKNQPSLKAVTPTTAGQTIQCPLN